MNLGLSVSLKIIKGHELMANYSPSSAHRFAQVAESAIEDYRSPDNSLRFHVERVVREYFVTLGDETPTGLYELIVEQVERPLLTVVLEQTRGNQTRCAQILGLNRGTLRKKLKAYDLM